MGWGRTAMIRRTSSRCWTRPTSRFKASCTEELAPAWSGDGRTDARLVTLEVTSMSIQPVETTPECTAAVVSSERVRGRVLGSRPMWLVWPSIVLLVVIIGIPLLIAIYISFLSLDQYTLRSWIHAPWVGLSNYVTALTSGNVIGASALVSLGVSLAFSLLTTLCITPIGILAALTVNTTYRGRPFVR